MAITRRYTASLATLALIAGSLIATTGATAAYAADAIDGPQTAGDTLFPNQGNGGYDALHYDITLAIDVAVSATSGAVATTSFSAATASILATTTGAPLKSYSFDFQGSTSSLANATLNVDAVTVNGVPATFSRIENTTTSNATTDNHKLIVTPATPVEGEFTTVVTYSGRPVAHTDTDGSSEGWNNTTDGATFLNQPVGAMTAFPNNNTPRDKATYTITLDVPTKLTTSTAGNTGPRDAAAVSNGELVSKTPSTDGTRTTWVWNQAKPMASELSLISVGRYDMYTSNITLESGRTIPEWTFIDPAISIANQTTTLGTRAQLKSILDFFESKYGPYPGNSTGLVTDIVPSAINYALETQDRSFFPNSASRGTTYHEVMHQWFGDGVSPTDWNDIWLNEGPATYSEYQFPFESAGSSTTTVEQAVFSLWSGNGTTFTVPPAAMTQASQLFGSQVYNRGAMTLEALRTAVGTATFATIMNQWQVRYSGQSKRTADFIALATEISGRDLTAFFQTWLYTPSKPAWQVKFNLTLAGPTAPVAVGDAAIYTLTARNTGKVAMPVGSVVTMDLTGVLDKSSLGALPANVTLSGNTLTWAVPATALAATSSVQFSVVPNPDTNGSALTAVAAVSTLGGTCIDCTQSLVIGAQPVAGSVPTITGGTPTVGVPLTAEPGTWTEGTTFSYQWLLDGTPIAGATSATYTPDGTVIGLALSVKVTGTNASFSPVTYTSAPTAVGVRAAFASAPTPTISGTPQIGVPLTAVPGAWDAGTVFTYQWQANGTNISGATGAIYTPAVLSQVGQTLTVVVTGTKFGRTTTAKTSAASVAVVAGAWVNSGATPTIAGSGRALAALAAQPGLWDDATTFSYVWSSNGTPISGATSSTYTPPVTLIGTSVTLTVTGSKPSYPAVAATTSAGITITAAAQTLSPTPTITGSKTVGSTLTAVPGTWDAGTTLTYQWLADGVAIDGATATTLPVTLNLLGKIVNVTVTSTRTNYITTSKTSTVLAPITEGSLTTTPTPTISGDPKLGTELTATAGTWDDGVSIAYQWLADGDAIAGAESASYTPGASQVGKVISVNAIGSKTGYLTVTKVSAATAAVAAGDLVDTPVPTITGTPKVGVALTAVPGTWDADTEFAYQWFANDVAIDGAIAAEYTPGPDRVGALITVAVTGAKFGYTSIVKTSDPTAEVALGDLGNETPVIAGTPKVDVLLSVLPGTWDAGTEFAYQWFADGIEIEGATASEFIPDATLAGALITVDVTGSKAGYEPVTKTSAETAAVADGDLIDTPVPTIAGTATVDETLTATAGDWDLDTTLAYQWFADEVAIEGATEATVILSPAEVDKAITVAVTGTKSGYVTVTKTSEATVEVSLATLLSTPVPTVTGTAQVGVELSVAAGDWDADVTLAYQWLVDGEDVAGATAATYTPASSDLGGEVTVAVTGSKPGYVSVTKSSEATDAVLVGTLTLTPVPTIAGTPKVGVLLLSQRGTWDAGTTFTYQWLGDGSPIAGATNSWYTPGATRAGLSISVAVTAVKEGYTSVTQTSLATAPVALGTLATTPVPSITGTVRVGVKVTATPGTWDAGVVKSYQWKRNGVAIAGATASTYTLGYSDLGKSLTVVVTGTKTGFASVSKASPAQTVALGVQTKQSKPVITGKPILGTKLTVKTASYDAGVTLTYVWFADGVAITGSNKTAITMTKSLKGKKITVQVTARKPGYVTVVGTSIATAKVS